MYSNMKYYENICNCLRVIQQNINRKLKSANCWQQTSLSNVGTFSWVELVQYLSLFKACFTSALRQLCAYLRRQISWFRTASSRCCEQHRKTALRKTRSQGCRNEFSTFNFLCDLFAFSERRTTAARHIRLSHDCCKTRKVFVRLM